MNAVETQHGAQFADALKRRLRSTPSTSIGSGGMVLKEAAVLAPLFWRGGEPWAYLTKRPLTLRKHPGQISFPGGGREPKDTTLLHTALRETQEELGLESSHIDVLGMLGGMPVITGFYATPFVGFVAGPVTLNPNPGEIAEVLEAPLWRLRREKRDIMHAERDVFVWDDARHVVWGATWRMLSQLLEHVDAVGR